MYYPYIRAKQFELLAIKDLLPILIENKDKVSIVIEPVKDSGTLKNVLNILKDNNLNFNFIMNPSVGDLCKEENIDTLLNLLKEILESYSNYQIGILVDSYSMDYYSEIEKKINGIGIDFTGYTLVHNSVNKDIENLIKIFSKNNEIKNNIINLLKTNSDRRYNRKLNNLNIVTLDDYFSTEGRNADYLKKDESSFSSEYLYYKNEGNKGFGDFLTIGDNYSEGGFRPYAVAIHISYKNSEEEIMVKHFVSDSNGDPSNVAGKFAEANKKLVEWVKNEKIPITLGINKFQELYESGHFPGLGVIKKLSIMNHIELVLNLIK